MRQAKVKLAFTEFNLKLGFNILTVNSRLAFQEFIEGIQLDAYFLRIYENSLLSLLVRLLTLLPKYTISPQIFSTAN